MCGPCTGYTHTRVRYYCSVVYGSLCFSLLFFCPLVITQFLSTLQPRYLYFALIYFFFFFLPATIEEKNQAPRPMVIGGKGQARGTTHANRNLKTTHLNSQCLAYLSFSNLSFPSFSNLSFLLFWAYLHLRLQWRPVLFDTGNSHNLVLPS